MAVSIFSSFLDIICDAAKYTYRHAIVPYAQTTGMAVEASARLAARLVGAGGDVIVTCPRRTNHIARQTVDITKNIYQRTIVPYAYTTGMAAAATVRLASRSIRAGRDAIVACPRRTSYVAQRSMAFVRQAPEAMIAAYNRALVPCARTAGRIAQETVHVSGQICTLMLQNYARAGRYIAQNALVPGGQMIAERAVSAMEIVQGLAEQVYQSSQQAVIQFVDEQRAIAQQVYDETIPPSLDAARFHAMFFNEDVNQERVFPAVDRLTKSGRHITRRLFGRARHYAHDQLNAATIDKIREIFRQMPKEQVVNMVTEYGTKKAMEVLHRHQWFRDGKVYPIIRYIIKNYFFFPKIFLWLLDASIWVAFKIIHGCLFFLKLIKPNISDKLRWLYAVTGTRYVVEDHVFKMQANALEKITESIIKKLIHECVEEYYDLLGQKIHDDHFMGNFYQFLREKINDPTLLNLSIKQLNKLSKITKENIQSKIDELIHTIFDSFSELLDSIQHYEVIGFALRALCADYNGAKTFTTIILGLIMSIGQAVLSEERIDGIMRNLSDGIASRLVELFGGITAFMRENTPAIRACVVDQMVNLFRDDIVDQSPSNMSLFRQACDELLTLLLENIDQKTWAFIMNKLLPHVREHIEEDRLQFAQRFIATHLPEGDELTSPSLFFSFAAKVALSVHPDKTPRMIEFFHNNRRPIFHFWAQNMIESESMQEFIDQTPENINHFIEAVTELFMILYDNMNAKTFAYLAKISTDDVRSQIGEAKAASILRNLRPYLGRHPERIKFEKLLIPIFLKMSASVGLTRTPNIISLAIAKREVVSSFLAKLIAREGMVDYVPAHLLDQFEGACKELIETLFKNLDEKSWAFIIKTVLKQMKRYLTPAKYREIKSLITVHLDDGSGRANLPGVIISFLANSLSSLGPEVRNMIVLWIINITTEYWNENPDQEEDCKDVFAIFDREDPLGEIRSLSQSALRQDLKADELKHLFTRIYNAYQTACPASV